MDSGGESLIPSLPRSVAIGLAIGGAYWGLLLFPWLASPLAFIVFGPGYLVTAGYVLRVVSTPPLLVRRLIWTASILVQGAWLCYDLGGGLSQVAAGRHFNEPLLPLAWWGFATLGSVVALFTERATPPA